MGSGLLPFMVLVPIRRMQRRNRMRGRTSVPDHAPALFVMLSLTWPRFAAEQQGRKRHEDNHHCTSCD
jgi:hypothetical protein